MFERIRVYRENRRYIQYEKRELKKISRLDCDTGRLRRVTASDIRDIFTNRDLDQEWTEVAGTLNAHCAIADGATSAVNPGDRRAIYYLIRGFRPKRILEIGTHVGASTVHIAAAISRENSNVREKPAIVSVDLEDVNASDGPWKRLNLSRSPAGMLDDIACGGMVTFIAKKSLDFLPHPLFDYDLIFLDGSHAASVVYQEIPLALRALRNEGVILLHDFFPGNKTLWPSNRSIVPGPWIAVERFRSEGVPLEVRPFGALPWPTKLGSNVTSLAILTRKA